MKNGEQLDLTGRRCMDSIMNQTLKDIEIIDNEDDGDACGEIVSIIYKGDHYQVMVRTEEEEDFIVDTLYSWNENDMVSISIKPEYIKLVLKATCPNAEGIMEYPFEIQVEISWVPVA